MRLGNARHIVAALVSHDNPTQPQVRAENIKLLAGPDDYRPRPIDATFGEILAGQAFVLDGVRCFKHSANDYTRLDTGQETACYDDALPVQRSGW